MIGPLRPPRSFIRSVFRHCGTTFVSLSRASTSFTATTSTKVGGDQTPAYVPNSENGRDEKTKDKAKSEAGKDDRPMIFLWDNDQPSTKGDGTVVTLPKCDVVFRDQEKQEKPARRPRQTTRHHFVSSHSVEDTLMKYYLNGKRDFAHSSSIFCVYNAGESTMPRKLLDAMARKVIILEAPRSGYLKKWQKFAKDKSHADRVAVKSYDFNRIAAGRVRDFHNNKGCDSLWQLFSDAGAVPHGSDDVRQWWGKEDDQRNNPPIRIMGVADPFKEHALFAALLYFRITRSSIYEFGPTELLTAISAQQYLDFHPIAADEKGSKTRRSRVPKLVRWRARLYRYLFDIDVVAKSEYDSFTPEISAKSKLKYEREGVSKSLYDELEIDTDKMYWISMRPRNCDELETLISKDYGEHHESDTEGHSEQDRRRQFPHLAGFAYMHKILSRHAKNMTMAEFLKSYFSEPELTSIDPKMTVDDGPTAVRIDDVVQMYKELAEEGGPRFYNSPFYSSAQEFTDSILYPSGPEEKKKDGRKKRVMPMP